MFGHLPELIIILVVGLIVFGPEKLPQAAADAGRMMREVRDALNTAMNPEDTELADDFSTYYYESLERSGEDIPGEEEDGTFADEAHADDEAPAAYQDADLPETDGTPNAHAGENPAPSAAEGAPAPGQDTQPG